MYSKVIIAAGILSLGFSMNAASAETTSAAAAAYKPRQIAIEALGKDLTLNVPPGWAQTAKQETTGPTTRVHYDWKNGDENVTLTFVAMDPPPVLRGVLHPRDEASLVKKMVIATYRLNDIDVENIVARPIPGRPNAYDLTCTTNVRSREPNTYPRPHTLSPTMSRPLPFFHSRADVRSTNGSYVNHMVVIVERGNVYMGCAAAKVEAQDTSAQQALESPMVASFLTSLNNNAF